MTIETRPAETPPEAPVKTVADVLRHAALIIEERGWVQDTLETAKGVCAIGALNIARFGKSDLSSAWDEAAISALGRQVGTDHVSYWNDIPGRTASEVTAALRAAADAWEADR